MTQKVQEQLRRTFEQRRKLVWKKLEEDYHLPQPMPPADCEQVDDDFEDELSEMTCEADLNNALASYQGAAERSVKTVAEYLTALTRKADRGHRPPQRTSRRRASPPSRRPASVYGQFSERRYLAILAFVLDWSVPLIYLLAERFKGPHRFRWQRLAQKWNRSHPNDQMKPATLGRYFRRAKVRSGIRERYLHDLRAKWRPWSDPLLRKLDEEVLRGLYKDTADYIRRHRKHQERARHLPKPKTAARAESRERKQARRKTS